MKLSQGTKTYYTGDRANSDGFGVVTDSYLGQVHIVMDDGRDFWVSESAFSEKYLGHGGTRFVTKAAYTEWREARIKESDAAIAAQFQTAS